MKNKILCGNTLEKLAELEDNSVDMAVTSPPYWGLRDYDCDDVVWGGDKDCEHDWNIEERELDNRTTAGLNKNFDTKTGAGGKFEGKHTVKSMFCKKCGAWKGQLGLEPHPEMFINNLVEIFREVRRVLKPTGSFYLNMGDTYFGGNMCVGQPDDWDSISTKNRDKKYSNEKFDGFIKQRNKLRSNWLQPKQLMLMPSRIAVAMQDDGWILRNDIIWSKPNPMPSSVTDRRNNSYEHVFHFVKNKKYYYDLDAIREPHKSNPGNVDKKTLATFDNSDKVQKEIDKHINNVYQLAKKTKRTTYEGSKTVDADDNVNAKDLTAHLATERRVARDYIKEHNLTGAVRKAILDYSQNSGGNPKGKNPGNVMKVPYAVQPRDKPYVEYRNLPDIKEFSSWLNDWRKGNGITIDEVEEKLQSQAPHHWFNGESFPSAEDWKSFKEVYDIADDYDKKLTEVFVKKSEKTNHPEGKNPGNVVRVEDCKYQGYSKSAHGTQDYHVSGKNPGNVLEVNTQPFKECHFAVFPAKLIEPLIKAGCPQKVCKKCGKPMIRETEVEGKSSYELLKGKDTSHYMSEQGRKQSMRAPIESYFRKRKTVGWKPTCDCDAGFEPGIVMDIFAGSGTACLVAKEMGRDYIGIELSDTYCQMARKRLAKNVTIHKWKQEDGVSVDELF